MRILFEQHLRPRFFPYVLSCSEEKAMSSFWSEDADGIVQIKLEAYRQYQEELKTVFDGI